MEITASDWETIRRVFREAFAAGGHFTVASVGADGAPHLTPIGSLVLGEMGRGHYFEGFAGGLAQRLRHDQRVCVMAVSSGKWELLKVLWRGQTRRPFGVRLHGIVGERREPTAQEVERFLRRVRRLRFLRGHELLWGGGRLGPVREVRFHAFEPVRLAPLGDPWPPSAPRPR